MTKSELKHASLGLKITLPEEEGWVNIYIKIKIVRLNEQIHCIYLVWDSQESELKPPLT